jgi:F-box domain
MSRMRGSFSVARLRTDPQKKTDLAAAEEEMSAESAALDGLPAELLEVVLQGMSVLDRLALRCVCRRFLIAVDSIDGRDARKRDGRELAEALLDESAERDALVFFSVAATAFNSGFGDVSAIRLEPRAGYHAVQLWFSRPAHASGDMQHAHCCVSSVARQEDFGRELRDRRLLDPYSYRRALLRRLACTSVTSEAVRRLVRRRFFRLARERASEFAHLLRDASTMLWLRPATPLERALRRRDPSTDAYQRAVIALCGLVEQLELARDASSHAETLCAASDWWRSSYADPRPVPFPVTEQVSAYAKRGGTQLVEKTSLRSITRTMLERLRLMYQQLR